MFQRLRMIFRAMFGWMLRGMENPELILKQYQDDMRAEIPRLNAQVAEIVALQKQLEYQAERQRARIATLEPQVIAAVKGGDAHKDAAMQLISALETAKSELADTEKQLETAKANSAQMLKAREAYERQIKQKIQEATAQLSRAKRAQIEEQMASLMMSFQTGDQTDTLDRMTEKIDQKLSRAEARTEVARTSVDAQMLEVQQQAAEDTASAKYEEYRKQLGLVPDTGDVQKTMEAIPVQTETEDAAAAPKPQTQTTEGTG
jgi:phage shock protein A